jgi:DNA helicase-2/ATP-dependent DNA helicase PcrA
VRDLLKGLNGRQKEAVSYCGGPLLVLAGAGSGKTSVLTRKLAYLVEERSIAPHRLLAVTFTNKASREMASRVTELLQGDLGGMEVLTFHAWGLRWLIRQGALLESRGLPRSFVVFDRGDSRSLVKRLRQEFNLDEKRYDTSWILAEMSRGKTECDLATLKPLTLATPWGDFYGRYQEELRRQGALDFDDLLVLPLHLMLTDPEALQAARGRYDWILVDEYQDVNRLQYQLLKLLTGGGTPLMVVGDPDQSIYGWRGADMEMILRFEKDFPGSKTVVLDQNYRSTGIILDAANEVIRNNAERRPKELWTARDRGEAIYSLMARNQEEEARFVADEIERLRTLGFRYGDMALLYRINALSRLYEQRLVEWGIPYRIVRGTSFYERREVKDALAFLRLAVNPRDRASLERIGNVPTRGLGVKSLERLADHLAAFDFIEPEAAWTEIGLTGAGLKGKAGQGVKELAGCMRDLLARGETFPEALHYILGEVGYGAFLAQYDQEGWEDRVENVLELLSVVPQGLPLAETLAEISLFTDQETVDDDEDRVNLLTLHAAKGLEFPVVFMVAMEEGIFPHSRCLDDNREGLEEERRLCYVGMTRAEDRLYLTGARSRLLFGSVQANGFSRFLWEIPDRYKTVDDRGREEVSSHVGHRPYRGYRRW